MNTLTKIKTSVYTKVLIATLIGVVAFTFALLSLQTDSINESCEGLLGDLNSDYFIDQNDETVLTNIVANQGDFNACGDLDENGLMGPGDITLLEQLVINQPSIVMTPPVVNNSLYETVNQQFTSNGQYVLNANSEYTSQPVLPVYSLSIDADVELPYEYSLVRVTLFDKSGGEHLVYEGYPLLTGVGNFNLLQTCDETCVLDNIVPDYLNVQVEYGSINIGDVYAAENYDNLSMAVKSMSIPAYADRLKAETDAFKVSGLKANIRTMKKVGLRWAPGETSVSRLSYAEKKRKFSGENLPNLQGFEYYKGGVFELVSPETPEDIEEYENNKRIEEILNDTSSQDSYNIVEAQSLTDEDLDVKITPITEFYVYTTPYEWDWRDIHGENWILPAVSQGDCNGCGAFAATAVVEGKINMWYNQHLDIDLSERDVICQVDDNRSDPIINIGLVGINSCQLWISGPKALSQFDNSSGINENWCMPYEDVQDSSYDCDDCGGGNKWRITRSKEVGISNSDIMLTLIAGGPVTLGIKDWNHSVAVIGYHKLKVDPATIAFRFKNSWGADWGDLGFGAAVIKKSRRQNVYRAGQPYVKNRLNLYQIDCLDRDNDGYCSWGISSPFKPKTCPDFCADTWDRNDCNPTITDTVQGIKYPMSCTEDYSSYFNYGRDDDSTDTDCENDPTAEGCPGVREPRPPVGR